MLASSVKGSSHGFPLIIESFVQEECEAAYHHEFLVNTLSVLHWPAFVAAAESLGIRDFPQSTPTSKKENDPFWKKFHHALLGIRVKEGYLVCPDSGRRFPILNGIPNMLLNEDEIA